MFETSEMRPIAAGTNAPPMMAITRNDEARLVSGPRVFRLSAKIVGNMMELKKPTRTIATTAGKPEETTLIDVQTSAPTPQIVKRRGAETRFNIHEPEKRPIMKPIWWPMRNSAAIFSGLSEMKLVRNEA